MHRACINNERMALYTVHTLQHSATLHTRALQAPASSASWLLLPLLHLCLMARLLLHYP